MTPSTAAHQASLSFNISRSLLKLMSIESVMPSNRLILYHPLLLLAVFPSIRVFFFQLEANYNIVLVLPYIDMNPLWVYTCSPSWTPLPSSLPIPSLWVIPGHKLWVPCFMHQTWTGHLFYIYQCYSLKSSHPCLLPQSPSPKACSLYLCLFCCFT